MGPSIDALTHHMAECPPEFLLEPGPHGVHTGAVVFDTLCALGQTVVNARAFDTAATRQQRIVLVLCWLLYHEYFRRKPPTRAEHVLHALSVELATVVEADALVMDPDRREEVARLLVAALGELPAGESETFAADRLKSISSIERKRLLAETRAQAEHAKRLREAMAEQRAREAASRYTGE